MVDYLYSMLTINRVNSYRESVANLDLRQVGQRLCTSYSMYNRVFLAGDAVHTHSPKAGRGMNVSIQDTYNLGWKLAHVIKGKAKASILRTYQDERVPIAMDLISFDKRMVKGICEKGLDSSLRGRLSTERQLEDTLREENTAASGLAVHYEPSCLVTKTWESRTRQPASPLLPHSRAELAGNVTVGTRFCISQVLFQCDSRPCDFQQILRSTGEWHLLVFGGDILDSTQMERVQRVAAELANEIFWVRRVNKMCDDRVGHIGAYLIHCAPRKAVEFMKLPEIFRPFDQILGYDYWRVFADNNSHDEGRGNTYRLHGIGAEGCLMLIRPDQHVAFIGSLEDLSVIKLFLRDFMV
jgi:phenol 2-monooxygenase (NADPH)